MRVQRVDELDLLVEVAAVDLDVAGLVDDLGRRVELAVDVGDALHDLRGAHQRALLAVHELAEAPRLDVAPELAALAVGHLVPPLRAEERVDLVGHADRVLGVDVERPVEAVAADPLAAGALVVQAEQLVAPVRVVEVEDRGDRAVDVEVVDIGRLEDRHGSPVFCRSPPPPPVVLGRAPAAARRQGKEKRAGGGGGGGGGAGVEGEGTNHGDGLFFSYFFKRAGGGGRRS